MISAAEAEAAIRLRTPLLPALHHPLAALPGLVLREAITMERDQPPFDRVAMDGIALQCNAALQGLREFAIAGTQAAGAAPLELLSATHCIEVMTGAQLPQGCDLVVPVEKITVKNRTARLNPDAELTPWLHVHRRGSDCRVGALVLRPGTLLAAAEIAVIASAGYAGAQASLMPRIAVISTGDELIEPGEPVQPWQIRRSNSYGILAGLMSHGFNRVAEDHVTDELEALRSRLRVQLDTHDVLILSGGVSMGQFDYVPQVLEELGVRKVFHKVAQRPGKPMWFGVRDDGKAVYGLPGNPVSTLVCLRRYVIPGLYVGMGGEPQIIPTVALGEAVKSHNELSIFLPVKLSYDVDAKRWAEPKPTQGSGDFISLLGTEGFIELRPGQGMMTRGAAVPFYAW
jgi:molybdopterin molybdotransferase